MLGQSWLNEALGDDDELTDLDRSGKTTTISAVVQGFLRNDYGFDAADIPDFINSALQNEASEIWQGRTDDLEMASAWSLRSEQALRNRDPEGAAEAGRTHDAMIDSLAQRYNQNRTAFGEATRTIQSTTEIPLSAETEAWLIQLDHDKYLSEKVGVKVGPARGQRPDAQRPAQPGERPARGRKFASSVDFSREAAEATEPVEPAEPTPVVEHDEALLLPSREEVPATTVATTGIRSPREQERAARLAKSVAALGKYHPTESDAETKISGAEPEVA
jgi:hypothetical protein